MIFSKESIEKMNRKNAKEVVETITNQQLKQMFERAKYEIKDWTQRSLVNKGMTKGTAWNVLAKDFDENYNYHIMAKINMVREFGEFLHEELKPINEPHIQDKSKPYHQDPIFK
jgi:hypothetical protein